MTILEPRLVVYDDNLALRIMGHLPIRYRYFEMGATSDERIYYTDYTSVMQAVAEQYPLGHQVAYDYMDEKWDEM